jgi:uncharacterized protein with beta-barrel porin domain
MTSVWACPGGITAAGLAGRPGRRFRDAFLGTVAAGALSLAFGGPAQALLPAGCPLSGGGTIETCTGDQHTGVAALPPPVTTLNVNSLTTAIRPASGTDGIDFNSIGAVTVTSNTGAFGIITQGANAGGIFASSSGSGATTVISTGNITTAGSNAFGIEASGNTGAVTVTSTGNITTAGNGAYGIRSSNNGAGAVTVTSTGNITTAGIGAYGIEAAGFGGSAVTVTSTGNISTAGSGAYGISAQTFGAGAVTVTSTGNITTGGSNAFGIEASGNTGAATVISIGNITTAGDHAYGIKAYSGGGGAVSVTSTGNITTAGNRAYGIETYSNTGATTVTSTGNITTAGSKAYGIAANNNGAGAITVTSTGNISTAGTNATGINVVSFRGGAVTVTSTGNITTPGDGASGIYAGSFGGPVTVTIRSGTVSGGSGSGAGVVLSGGSNNTLTNFGTVTALSGLAVQGDTGNDTVNNSGTVTGNVLLGSGTNAFNNMAGGLFNPGASVDLGGGSLTNAGTLSPGGVGTTQTTALTGNLTQAATGILLADINIAGATSDRFNVSGTANLAGSVQVQVSNATLGAWQQTVLSATGGTTNNGLSLLASPALHAQLIFPNATDVAVKSSGINFLTPGLGTNQAAVGNALNGAALTAGLGGPVFNLLLNTNSVPAYGLALTQLSGEAATGTQQTTFDAMNTFMGTMLDPFNRGTTSTPGGGVSGYASEGETSAYAADGRRRSGAERDAFAMFTKAPPQNFEARWNVWAAGFGGSQTTDGNAAVGSNGATSRIAAAAVGAEYRFSPNTIAGFALAGGGTNYVVGNGLGSGRSDLFQAGAYARHTMGAAYIAGALAYGWQDVTTNRTVTLAGLDQLAGPLQRQRLLRPARRRLSFCLAVDGRRRHTLCRRSVHHLRPARLCRTGCHRHQQFRAGLWRQERHRSAQRTRLPRRQVLGDDRWHRHPAGAGRMGARFQPRPHYRCDVPDAAGRILRREWCRASKRLRARHSFHREEVAEWLVGGHYLRG